MTKNYSTLAELKIDSYNELVERYPYIIEEMEKHMGLNYRDKWKKFMKKSLRNIDYLNYETINDKIIEDITYTLELIDVKQGDHLFKAGTQCQNIYMISNGQIEIYVNNNGKDCFIDTLYTG